LPGPFVTDRIRSNSAAEAKTKGVPVDDLIAQRSKEHPAGRFGDPAEFGAACAFLCSQHAGFITGQNLLLDGGAFRGTL
jgi:3-oxoacyl-[acyl-carrier protein] reductase